ncbi:MAG: cobalamin-binding protein [Desulfomonile tiedjei]|uniref:Cobalamin-binding protein n=1 Tax=Desulfomonile tiedjei TaxID=2358 RepID=A0A9D6V8I7_9BACT|nr:cobalamin-binding protein [Desulfomonile tiedjei]
MRWSEATHIYSYAKLLFSRRTPKNFTWLPWRICGLVAVSAILFVPPAKAEPSPKVCVEDDLSRQVCVSAFPKRVISLAPSLTEIVFDLGAGHTLVGRTARCNEPPEVLKIQDIGAYMNPDLERIIALRPDLVLSPESGMRKEVVDRLTDLGIPTFVDNSRTLDEIVYLLSRLGTILGRESDAKTVAQQFRQRRQAVRERVDHVSKPLILFAVGIRPLVLAGGRSFIGSLIREAGGTNVAEDATIPYPKFNMEEVAKRDPDIIIVLNKECREDECFNEWQKHQALSAVRNNQIYQLDADLVARASARIMDALEQLAAIFHPKVFGSGLSVGVNRTK